MTLCLAQELSRFGELRRRLIVAEGDYDDALLREAIEGVCNLHGAIRSAVQSALEDESAASRLRGRLDEMEARLRVVERRAQGKRQAALLSMLDAGLDSLEAPGVRIAVRHAPPVIVVSDESLIPGAYRVPQPAWLDYQAIRDALTSGAEVPGAALAEPEPYLSVRTD